MNVDLTPELERMVQSRVRTGRYNSVSEVIREALRLLEERDELKALRKEEIKKKIADGLESLRRGQGLDGEATFDRMEAELDELERSGHA